MERIAVLYAEDNPTDARLTIRHLQRHAPHFVPTLATSARECLERLDRETFDLIVLDYQLPDRDGLQILGEIIARRLEVPVVMVTGSGDPEIAVRALKAGAFDYVVKRGDYLFTLPAVMQDAIARFRASVRARLRRKIRVLQAEADRAAAEQAERNLSTLAPHITLETAGFASECMRLLESHPYDVLLTTYRLPDMDGLSLLKEIRMRGMTLPVVMVTAEADEEVAVQALKLGVCDYLVKREGYHQKLPSILENALAQHHLAREREALITLHELVQTVASSLDTPQIFARVIEGASTLLGAEKACLHLLSEDGSELVPVTWKGAPDETARQLRFRVGEGLVGQAARTGRALVARDLRDDPRALYREWAVETQAVAAVSVPLFAMDKLLGVLSVATRMQKEFSHEDRRLLAILADHTAVAIENARLYEEVQRAATQLEAKVEERTNALQAATAKVREASRHKSEFLANMSHELRTPLNSIIGFSELLEDQRFGSLNDKQQRYVRNIWAGGQHLLNLISDILDLSKVEAGKLDITPEVFSSEEGFTPVLSEIDPQLKAKGLTLELAVAPGLSVTADPTRFRQILFNLLSNAVKFTPEGGRITVTAHRVHGSECRVQGGTSAHEPSTMNYERIEDWVEIAVQDTGIGIKAEDMPKLFQEFTQLDSSLAKRHQGTGLGLALTKRLVELHGGQIRAESPGEGQGSTFIVTLPFHAPRSPQRRLLLVEDDTAFGEALAAVLERAGYAVEVIGDGREALSRLEQSPPDVLLLDMVLPGCDGRDVLASLRGREGTRRLPVIAITGVLADLEEEIRTLGADDFLTKPFSTTVLLDVIGRFVGRAHGGLSTETPRST